MNDRYPNLQLMLSSGRFYAFDPAQTELADVLAENEKLRAALQAICDIKFDPAKSTWVEADRIAAAALAAPQSPDGIKP